MDCDNSSTKRGQASPVAEVYAVLDTGPIELDRPGYGGALPVKIDE